MKKIYNVPQIKVVNINPKHQMLTGSITINSGGDAVDASNAAARSSRFSTWGDGDNEE